MPTLEERQQHIVAKKAGGAKKEYFHATITKKAVPTYVSTAFYQELLSASLLLDNLANRSAVVGLLKEGNALEKNANIVMFYARKFLGKPYVPYTLDQELEERLVINTEGLDCTTYVENVMALTICTKRKLTSFKDFCKVLAHV